MKRSIQYTSGGTLWPTRDSGRFQSIPDIPPRQYASGSICAWARLASHVVAFFYTLFNPEVTARLAG